MSSSHPFGSRRDWPFLREFICWIYNCNSFNVSVLHPDFWDYVPCRRKRITNPWLKSLSKAQHCVLKRKKKILENVFFKTVIIPTSQLVSFLDWRSHNSFPLQPSSMLVCWAFLTTNMHHPDFFFILFQFSCRGASQLQTVLSNFFWNSAFHKSMLRFAGGRTGFCWTLRLPWHSFTCVWIFVFSKPFWWSCEQTAALEHKL